MLTSRSSRLAGRSVLVTDGEQRAALAIVRSLGAAGAVPFVTSRSGRSLAGASRFAAGDETVADPLTDPAAFVAGLAAIAERRSIAVLLPVTEAALRPVLQSRSAFGDVRIPFPTSDTFARASDKRQMSALAEELGIPVPRQEVLESAADAEALAGNRLRFPLVLKPAVSVGGSEGRLVKLSVSHVADADELSRLVRELPPAAFPLLVQERIVGPGVGVFLLRWEDRILARFAHRRLREKPPSGGVSVYRESVALPGPALQYAEQLLDHINWQGVAMVEFKYDRDTNVPYLMEINGRFWGSLQLAIDAGVDFPRLLLEAAAGRFPACPVEGRPGVRLRWLLGDLDHLLIRLRGPERDLSLPPDAPGRLLTLARFLVPWRPGDRWEILRPSDPRPFLREIALWTKNLADKSDR